MAEVVRAKAPAGGAAGIRTGGTVPIRRYWPPPDSSRPDVTSSPPSTAGACRNPPGTSGRRHFSRRPYRLL